MNNIDLEEIWRNHYPQWVRRKVDIPDISIYQVLEEAVKKYSKLTAIERRKIKKHLLMAGFIQAILQKLMGMDMCFLLIEKRI